MICKVIRDGIRISEFSLASILAKTAKAPSLQGEQAVPDLTATIETSLWMPTDKRATPKTTGRRTGNHLPHGRRRKPV